MLDKEIQKEEQTIVTNAGRAATKLDLAAAGAVLLATPSYADWRFDGELIQYTHPACAASGAARAKNCVDLTIQRANKSNSKIYYDIAHIHRAKNTTCSFPL